ncbi:outer membrane beta-barrel protein [Flammeovirga agarivorans]|uniref:Porin family protein n=1 Tax=Flammeovirga agarivorans TaxID=2726742 RepID=A0A7X8SH21_9BACT|nr:outer membrane beta-barrel protein [Flammeovirga agarivorans]NLR90044.1 porin family protein [Flammeovirga agarivorans]
MKKIFFIILCSLSFYQFANAQDKLLNFGVKTAVGMSDFSISGNHGINTDTRQSWEGGIMLRANIPVLPIYAQIEANYTNAGSTLSYNDVEQELITNRVEVPILLGARFSLGEIAVRGFGGVIAQKTVRDNLADFDSNLELNDFGWGWQAGVGADIKKFTVDLKYQRGANIITGSNSIESNQYLLSVGYFIW